MRFSISSLEIERRKKAFSTFILSILTGSIVSTVDVILKNPLIFLIIYFIFTMLLLSFRILTIKSLVKFSKIELFLDDKYIRRKTIKSEEAFLIDDIKKIHVKRTINSKIRQIKIVLNSGNSLYINGLKNFEVFYESLINRCDNNITIQGIKEPLDLDHPLFYFFLGFITGSLLVFSMRLIYSVELQNLKNVYIGIMVFNLITGLFLIIKKQISKTYGPGGISADHLIGGLIIIFSILNMIWFF